MAARLGAWMAGRSASRASALDAAAAAQWRMARPGVERLATASPYSVSGAWSGLAGAQARQGLSERALLGAAVPLGVAAGHGLVLPLVSDWNKRPSLDLREQRHSPVYPSEMDVVVHARPSAFRTVPDDEALTSWERERGRADPPALADGYDFRAERLPQLLDAVARGDLQIVTVVIPQSRWSETPAAQRRRLVAKARRLHVALYASSRLSPKSLAVQYDPTLRDAPLYVKD